MKQLLEDLKKKEYAQMYLLYGEEEYLKNQYKKQLRNALLPEDDTINYAYFEGKSISMHEVISLAETMPFFAERRVIFMENTGLFKSGGQELAEYLPHAPKTAFFIFVEGEVDKRNRAYKAVKEKGRAVEFARQDEKTLMKWVLSVLKRENKKITEATMQLFLSKTGTDMEHIEKELEKLLCYCMDREVITSEDVEEICVTQISNRIFNMIHAISEKKQKEALNYYYDLLALKEPPMRILFLMVRAFNQLLQVKDLLAAGFDRSSIAAKLKLQSFIVNRAVNQSRGFTEAQLREAIEDCAAYEEAVKTGRMDDRMGVELLILKYSS